MELDLHNSLLHQPLLSTAPTNFDDDNAGKTKTFSSNRGIVIRLLIIFFIGIISVWANFEASKGFDLTIINEDQHSLAGKRFDLFYVSNDKATRILLNASKFVEHLLYDVPNVDDHRPYPKKQVSHVTLRLASRNLSELVVVHSSGEESGFVINLSPQVMEDANVNHAMVSAIQRGMARVWLWDGKSKAPQELLAGMVEYISMVAGLGDVKSYSIASESPECGRHVWWVDEDPKVVAKFLRNWEDRDKGFIQRLNGGMKDGWHDRTVYDAVGIEAQQHLCG